MSTTSELACEDSVLCALSLEEEEWLSLAVDELLSRSLELSTRSLSVVVVLD